MDKAGTINEQVYRNSQKMTQNDEDINILLLGETGVGKSTFINAFANYMEYEKFDIAEVKEVRWLIPGKFTVTSQNLEEILIKIGKDHHENDAITHSPIMETRSYLFPIARRGLKRIRLIDTPSIGDTRSIDQDNESLENILSYISHLENLHAICFLLKPNNRRLTRIFKDYFKTVLSRLEKSASRNIIFLFTNTRDTFYKPGDTTTALEAMLTEIKSESPHADINFTEDNVFCLDNEAFPYLLAAKNDIQLGDKQSFIGSWNQSVNECWRMLHFVSGQTNSIINITPHKMKDTMSINEVRRIMIGLFQPLVDTAKIVSNYTRIRENFFRNLDKDYPAKEDASRRAGVSRKSFSTILKLVEDTGSFGKENDAIIITIAKCDHFLQHNIIAPYTDSFKIYIDYLIERETLLKDNSDFKLINCLNQLLLKYTEKKKEIDKGTSLTATCVFDSINDLYDLHHTGRRIEYTQMARSQANERRNRDVVLERVNQGKTLQDKSNFICQKCSLSAMTMPVVCEECDGKTYCCKSATLIEQALREKERIINELIRKNEELNKSHVEKKRLIENLVEENQNMKKLAEQQPKAKEKQIEDVESRVIPEPNGNGKIYTENPI